MSMWWVAGALYALGAVGTGLYNIAIIIGPVTNPLAVVRNALFWPLFLPILISMNRGS